MTLRGQVRNWATSIRTTLRASAYSNKKLVEPTVTMIGAFSRSAEKQLRLNLALPPTEVQFSRSPTGATLVAPVRMTTCEGRDQISRLLYYKGWAYEHPFPSLLEAALRFGVDGLFFDIGANTGLYSLLSKAIRPQRGVHAFEPFSPVRDILQTNIGLNSLATDIVIVDVAASDTNGTAELFIPTQEHGLVETSASLSSTFKSQLSEIITINTVRLDDYCRQLGLGPVSVMKIDVEGAEHRVLSGALELMARDRPIIFCEILPDAEAWSLIPSIFTKTGYLRASIHREALVVHEDAMPDRTTHNHILFPSGLRPTIVEIARAAAVQLVWESGRPET